MKKTLHLDSLSDDQLDAILRSELDKDIPNEEIVLGVLSALREREEVVADEEVMELWRKYQSDTGIENIPKKKRAVRWIGYAAAVLAVVFTLALVTPKALGAENIFQLIARWTQDLFSFGAPAEEYVFQTDHPGLQEIYNAVVEQGITEPVVPMWVPEGYELEELKITPCLNGVSIYALLTSADGYISFSYEISDEDIKNKYPKDKIDVEELEFAGISHYIIPNDESTTVAWNAGNIECMIVTNQSAIITQIITSVYN